MKAQRELIDAAEKLFLLCVGEKRTRALKEFVEVKRGEETQAATLRVCVCKPEWVLLLCVIFV